jgi:hypothetical protein
VFQQNFRLDFVHKVQGGRMRGKPFQVKLADDEARSADPFGIPVSQTAAGVLFCLSQDPFTNTPLLLPQKSPDFTGLSFDKSVCL